MLRTTTKIAISEIALVLSFASLAAHAETGDVPRNDPAYAAVQTLANDGLLGGYLVKEDVFRGRTLTRYEMAALAKRGLNGVDAAKASGKKPSSADQAAVAVLVDEFGVELAVIGVDVSSVKAAAVQMAAQQKQIDSLAKSKVTAGYGTVKFDGVFQVQYLNGADVTCTGLKPGAIGDTFKIRHCDLKFSGDIDKQTYWWLLFDPSRNANLTVPASGGTVATNTVSPLYDYVLGYHLNPTVDVEVGQQKLPITLETTRSSANLLLYDRSLMNLVPWGAGRFGESRDLGAWLRYTKPKTVTLVASVTDDAGNRQDTTDDNNAKELCLNGQVTAIRNVTFGAYGEISGGVGSTYRQRRRFGADIDYANGRHELLAEYGEGYDGNGANRLRVQSAYATYAYRFARQWQGAARVDMFNPNRDKNNQETDLTLGLNWLLNGNNSKIQLDYVRKNIAGPLGSASGAYGPAALPSLGVSRSFYVVNVQQAF